MGVPINTVQELMTALETMVGLQADMKVVIDDADTGWLLGVSKLSLEHGYLVIGGEYHGDNNPEQPKRKHGR